MNKILKKLNIDNKLTKNHEQQKVFNKVWLETRHEEDYNFMADLIEFVKSPEGYKYLLVVVDLYTLEFDIEPLKNKTPNDTLEGLKKMFKRRYLNAPKASISTDGGTEFKGVFHKWFWDQNLYHKVGAPYRHKQQSVVESLNNQITKIIMLYINFKSQESGEEYTNWVSILDLVRYELNNARQIIFNQKKKKYKDYSLINQNITKRPKFYKGQVVHYRLDYPENFNMQKQATPNFRNGDFRFSQEVRKITKTLHMNSYPWYRYMLEGINNRSFSEYDLLPSDKNYSTFKVKRIIGDEKRGKQKYYLVWFEGELKKQASWQPEKALLEDGLKDHIDDYIKNRDEARDKQLTKAKDKRSDLLNKKIERDKQKELRDIEKKKLQENQRTLRLQERQKKKEEAEIEKLKQKEIMQIQKEAEKEQIEFLKQKEKEEMEQLKELKKTHNYNLRSRNKN